MSKNVNKPVTDAKKLKAIQHVIKHGFRHSEWAEAGLLRLVEEIVNDELTDLSSDSLKQKMFEASKF